MTLHIPVSSHADNVQDDPTHTPRIFSSEVDRILSSHGWTCSEEDFAIVLKTRIETDSRVYPPTGRKEVRRDEDRGANRPIHPSTRIQCHSLPRGMSRHNWGPRDTDTRYLVSDDAIPFFIQMVLPQRMPETADQLSLDGLRDYLKETYATRSRRYATIIEIRAAQGGGEAHQNRFGIVRVGPWRDFLSEIEITDFEVESGIDFKAVFLSPYPASPARDRVAAECVEFAQPLD